MSSKLCTDVATDASVWRGGVLELAGRDAGAFAQAQLMNDVRQLGDGQWQWTGWLTPKGRVQALAALLRLDAERFWLLLPDAPATALAEGLQRFRFRSKLTLEVRTDIGLYGFAGAPAALGSAAHGAQAAAAGADWVLDMGGAVGRTLWAGARAPVSRDDALDAAAFAVEDLAHGLPRLDPRHEAAHTPHMLGLERLAAFSVKKGCYPGQEIVARTHFLGQAKRGLQRLSFAGPLAAGEALSGDGGSHAVLCAAASGARREALAVLPLEAPVGGWLTAAGEAVNVIAFAEGLAR